MSEALICGLVDDLMDNLGPDTDFDEYGFTIKRGDLRKLLAQIAALQAHDGKLVRALAQAATLLLLVAGGTGNYCDPAKPSPNRRIGHD